MVGAIEATSACTSWALSMHMAQLYCAGRWRTAMRQRRVLTAAATRWEGEAQRASPTARGDCRAAAHWRSSAGARPDAAKLLWQLWLAVHNRQCQLQPIARRRVRVGQASGQDSVSPVPPAPLTTTARRQLFARMDAWTHACMAYLLPPSCSS